MARTFVIGTSGNGKTPFAKALSYKLLIPYVSAGAWVRERWPQREGESREVYTARMTAASLEVIAKDPVVVCRYVEDRGNCKGEMVIDSVRNPRDFMRLFDPANDTVYHVHYRNNTLPPTEFEGGLDIIENYLLWAMDTGLMPEYGYRTVSFDRFWERECALGESSLERIIREVKDG